MQKIALQNKLARWGVLVLMCAFPFFITNAYHNITFSKYFFFSAVSAFALAACLLATVRNAVSLKLHKTFFDSLSVTDISMFAFTLVAVVSAFFSDYSLAALSGSGGRRMGLVMMLALFFAYVFISRFYIISEKDFVIFGIFFSAMCLFSFIQYLGFDPLKLLAHVSIERKCKFIGFIGNINVFSSYISLILPMFMYMFCYAVENKEKIIYTVFCAFGFIGLIISNSDNGYLGVMIAFAVLAFMTLADKKLFKNLLQLIIIFASSGAIVRLLGLVFKNSRSLSFLSRVVSNKFIIAGVIVFSLAFMFAVDKISDKVFAYGKRVFVAATLIGCAAVLLMFALFSFINREVNIGPLETYLRFGDEWASDRGGIWTRTFETFKRLPFSQKLFGTGPDTLAFAVVGKLGISAFESLGFAFDNAHNDLLQYLVTLGVWGMLAYIFAVSSAAVACIKSKNAVGKIVMICIASYFVQSLFCITQPIVTPLFFMFIAFTQCKVQKEA